MSLLFINESCLEATGKRYLQRRSAVINQVSKSSCRGVFGYCNEGLIYQGELKKLCWKVRQSSCFHSGMCCCGLEKILWGFPSERLRPLFCILWTPSRIVNIPNIKCRESSTICMVIFVLKNIFWTKSFHQKAKSEINAILISLVFVTLN